MRLALALVLALSLAGCGKKNVPSAEIAGSFVRQDALFPGLVTRLHVTPTGLTVTTPTASVGTTGSVGVNGKPLFSGSTQMELGFAAHGAALFATVLCQDDRACAFTTKNGCEGTLTADGKGNVVLVATGECGPWSGKWIAEKDAPSVSACPPAPSAAPAPCPPCPPGVAPDPFASAAPSGAPSAGPPRAMGCHQECSRAQMACVQQCKVADSTCMHKCGETTMECMQRCPAW